MYSQIGLFSNQSIYLNTIMVLGTEKKSDQAALMAGYTCRKVPLHIKISQCCLLSSYQLFYNYHI